MNCLIIHPQRRRPAMPNRTPEEQLLLDKAGRYLPGGNGNLTFSPELDFLVAGGRGSRVWDVSGNEYVDWLMGSGPMISGPRPSSRRGSGGQDRRAGQHLLCRERQGGPAGRGPGRGHLLRRKSPLHHQRYRRLLPGHAGGSCFHRPGEGAEVRREATTAPATTP